VPAARRRAAAVSLPSAGRRTARRASTGRRSAHQIEPLGPSSSPNGYGWRRPRRSSTFGASRAARAVRRCARDGSRDRQDAGPTGRARRTDGSAQSLGRSRFVRSAQVGRCRPTAARRPRPARRAATGMPRRGQRRAPWEARSRSPRPGRRWRAASPTSRGQRLASESRWCVGARSRCETCNVRSCSSEGRLRRLRRTTAGLAPVDYPPATPPDPVTTLTIVPGFSACAERGTICPEGFLREVVTFRCRRHRDRRLRRGPVLVALRS
jgi:hypothetical protein